MNEVLENNPYLKQVLNLIEFQFGDKCEVILHDLTKDYNHTIVDIRNGHITNRNVGGSGTNLGLEVLSGNVEDGDRFNYITRTPSGRVLRSSSIYLKDSNGIPTVALCVNYDITEFLALETMLHDFNRVDTEQNEVFVQDVTSLLDHIVGTACAQIGRPVEEFSKEERIRFIGTLDQKGAFLITHSSEKICELLGISRYTFYNYLELSRSRERERNK